MLIKCPECQLQASDKAASCPHCGYPFRTETRPRATRKSNKRKRLPNGFGQISEIKGRNLRNPFRAMVTVGKTDTGKPICELLKPNAYFATYNDAYAALLEYNKNPYDLDSDITLKELYDRWSKQHFSSLKSETGVRNITSAWAYCSSVYDMKVVDIRTRHIKGCMENGRIVVKGVERSPSPTVQTRIKSVFNLLLDYALEYELIDRNYARSFNVSDKISKEAKEVEKEHMSFTDDEMQILWDNINKIQYVDVVLIQCYSGWRPQEIGLIKLEDVDLEGWTFTGGIKTDAGENRTVPIHSKIRHLVQHKYNEAIELKSDYLINCTDTNTARSTLMFTYDKYRHRFEKVRDRLRLDPNHRPHDPRKQFVTMAKRYNVDEYAIKYMTGHVIIDITEKVYTDRDVEWLKTEIEKIK